MRKILLPKVICKKCEVSWSPRTGRPKKCPYCQSREWDKPVVARKKLGKK